MKIILIILFNICCVYCLFQEQDPDQFRDALQIIKSRGFIAEEHKVITPDGYILALQRIINPYIDRNDLIKPLLLVHGILASSTDWIMNSHGFLDSSGAYIEDSYRSPIAYRELNGKMVPIGGALGFVLSQFGYDVWLANCRGNTYSKNHTFLNHKTDSQYWSFTLDQISMFDISSMINYVLKATNRDSMGYICHSQGCTVMFALLSSKPTYSRFIDDFIALSPVVFASNTYGIPLRPLSPLHPIFRALPMGILTPIKIQLLLQGILCRDKSLRYVCGILLGIFTGLNPKQVNYERMAAFGSHFPTGVSTWVLAHFLQLAGSERFAKFDYGKVNNIIRYGQTFPPDYPLHKINLKRISIFYSLNDAISEYNNVLMIKKFLKVPLLSENLIMDPKWGHFDYFTGKNVGFYINSKILDILRHSDIDLNYDKKLDDFSTYTHLEII